MPATPRPDPGTPPSDLRAALSDLVQLGMRVARMVAEVADTEAVLAAAAREAAASTILPPLATSLAEAIAADQATAAAAAAQQAAATRAEAVARTFARVARSVRMTVLLAERMDRGWARRSAADDRHAMTRRHVARAVADAIAQQADGPGAERLTERLAERLERLDIEDEIGTRPADDIIREICRDLGLDPVRTALRPAPSGPAARNARPAARPPDG